MEEMYNVHFVKDRLAKLTDVHTKDFAKDFIYQIDISSSEDFNHVTETIFEHLETLYEKTRLLQDLTLYLKTFLEHHIATYKITCETLLKEIETDRDKLKQRTYQTIPVSLIGTNHNYKDRNEKVLENCSTYMGYLVPHYNENEAYAFSEINKAMGFKAYRSNLTDLLTNGIYRTFYLLDAPVIGGLKEKITCIFENKKDVNYLEIITSNCKVETLCYLEDNQTREEDHFVGLLGNTQSLTGLSFYLNCDNYTTKTYYYDSSRSEADCWDKIAQSEYAKLNGAEGLSVAEQDKILGLAALKEAYDKYLKEIEKWKEDRKSIAEINRSNGYEDEVPEIDILTLPAVLGLDYAATTNDSQNVPLAILGEPPLPDTSAVTGTATIVTNTNNYTYNYNKANTILPSVERYRYQSVDSQNYQNDLFKINPFPGN